MYLCPGEMETSGVGFSIAIPLRADHPALGRGVRGLQVARGQGG